MGRDLAPDRTVFDSRYADVVVGDGPMDGDLSPSDLTNRDLRPSDLDLSLDSGSDTTTAPQPRGDYDLVISGFSYENTGTRVAPAWTRRPGWDLPETDRHVTFGDLDGDGDMDVLLGVPGQSVSVPLRAYRNVGSAFSPSWSRKTAWDPPGGAPSHRVYHGRPALADLDTDGDLDLLVGTQYDGVYGVRNAGSRLSPVWERMQAWDVPAAGGNMSAVTFADLNDDQLVDLIQSQVNQVPRVFLNVGTATQPAWSTVPSFTSPTRFGVWDYVATLADLDDDGDYDMIYGTEAAHCHAFRNDGSKQAPTWVSHSAWNPPQEITPNARPVLVDLDAQ